MALYSHLQYFLRIHLFITQETAHVSRACDDDKLIQARKDKERHIKEHDYSKHTQNGFLIYMFLWLLLFYTLKQSLKTQKFVHDWHNTSMQSIKLSRLSKYACRVYTIDS